MVSRKTQLAWMAAGGVLCLFTVIISCKVREGNRVDASGENPPVTIVPLPSSEPPVELKPLPGETSTALPPISPAANLPFATQPTVWTPTLPVPMVAEVKPPTAPTLPTPAETRSHRSVVPVVLQEVAPPAEVKPTVPDVKPSIEIKPPFPEVKPPLAEVVRPPDATPPQITGTPLPSITPPMAPPAIAPAPKPSVRIQGPMASADPVAAPPGFTPSREPGEPPLAPQPGPVVQYHVRQGGEFMSDIAKRTLGSSDRWVELVRFNPTLPHDSRLSAGTMVRLPADACIPTEELEVVKPLPGLKPVKAETIKPKTVLPLTGTYPCNLDDQRALLLPKSIRDQFDSTETLMLSPGTDQCLWLTTPMHLERLAQRMEQSQAKEIDVHAFKRLYFAQTEKVTMTPEGRVVISDRLAQFAGLRQEIVLVGIDDHFELWDVTRWKDFTQKKSAAARANIAAEQE